MAHRGLVDPAFKGIRDRFDLLRGDRERSAALPIAALRRGEAGHPSFARRRALILGERAEHREQHFAMRCGRNHLFGQRPKCDMPVSSLSRRPGMLRQAPMIEALKDNLRENGENPGCD
ncbi:hypothetical protein [Sphingomonas faeni]|uniref:hypothetical protein n=1 Tax=Sphingomonas faeni TaxID=185950 RepID=UPI003D7FE8B4